MTDDSHVDGNALGGLLQDMFGREMTDQRGCCGNCGAVAVLAALEVYRNAPGDVVRCASCGAVLLVIVDTPTGTRLSLEAMRWVELPTDRS